jgi:hypothetical protein
VSRGAGVVAKLGFFVLVVVVGVVLFSRDFRRTLSNRWGPTLGQSLQEGPLPNQTRPVANEPVSADGMSACAGRIQADIHAVMPWVEPKVARCEGIATRATCSVETNAPNGRKTAPVKDWDCSTRHVSQNSHREWVREETPKAAVTAQDREIEAWTAQVKDQFARGLRYVVAKMAERQQVIGEPDPYPRVVASPNE